MKRSFSFVALRFIVPLSPSGGRVRKATDLGPLATMADGY
jgi:hypothetical protein